MKIKVDDHASLTKRFSADEVSSFARLTGDANPLHADGDLAQWSMFGQPVVHGFFVAGLISALLGTKLPGRGTIYLSQDLSFKAPVFFDDEVTARVRVLDIKGGKGIVTLATSCEKGDGTIVIKGKAVVMHPDLRDSFD